MKRQARLIVAIVGLGMMAAIAGCAPPNSSPPRMYSFGGAHRQAHAGQVSFERSREFPMYAGRTGTTLAWSDLELAAAWADIIILGEQHDDAGAHAVQLAVVEDVFARWPDSTLCLEMLERDEQHLVDEYLDGLIDAETFATVTHSTNWGAEGKWMDWYQPIVDAAKDSGGAVIAANAPRRYVRAARIDGYDRLQGLPRERRRWFDFPSDIERGGYWRRFVEVMTPEEEPDDSADAGAKPQAANPHGGPMTMERLRNGFRSQLLWDATMAGSIARAKRAGAKKVVHLIGQFHSDFEGGTVLELRRRLPRARILTISMQRRTGDRFDEKDRNRADIVVYTGAPPSPSPEAEDEELSDGETEVEQDSADQSGIGPSTCRVDCAMRPVSMASTLGLP